MTDQLEAPRLTFRHKGLKLLYDTGTTSGVDPRHSKKLRRILLFLGRSSKPIDMNLPGFNLHGLKGRLEGHYAVSVSGNWRVTFRFENGRACDIDYLDYH